MADEKAVEQVQLDKQASEKQTAAAKQAAADAKAVDQKTAERNKKKAPPASSPRSIPNSDQYLQGSGLKGKPAASVNYDPTANTMVKIYEVTDSLLEYVVGMDPDHYRKRGEKVASTEFSEGLENRYLATGGIKLVERVPLSEWMQEQQAQLAEEERVRAEQTHAQMVAMQNARPATTVVQPNFVPPTVTK